MFRFWSTDPRGSEKTVEATLPMPLFAKPVHAFLEPTSHKASFHSGNSLKRRRLSVDDTPLLVALAARDPLPAKRIKLEPCKPRPDEAAAAVDRAGVQPEQRPPAIAPPSASPASTAAAAAAHIQEPAPATRAEPAIERAKDVIQFQLGLEILYKHDELRLINQELAKCQVALEQLRRCHLIPYPVTCPTPEQMLDVSSGKGPAVRARPGEPVPEWAPPFGVVDGPYARHYAKWLIPDPKFDGVVPEWQGLGGQAASSSRSAVEGRTTRNSYGDAASFGKQRPARGIPAHKLHSLSSGYAQPKDKAGPCVLKRSDGKTVKLVCIDCHRENFSSTQGFINHCRIAHKRDFKSHEEAAVHCGHPIEVDEAGSAAGEEKPAAAAGPSPAAPSAGSVHPFARATEISEQQALAALRVRVEDALRLYEEGKSLPHTAACAAAPLAAKPASTSPGQSFVGASEMPHLSRLLKGKNFSGDLREHIADARTREDTPDLYLDDDSEGEQASNSNAPASPVNPAASARGPGVMRMPARAVMVSSFESDGRPVSSKGCAPPHLAFETPIATPTTELPQTASPTGLFEDEMDVDLSPNTMASNTAPSLVSDDGEYDDSDDGSSSDVSDSMDTDSVTEIKLEDDHEVQDQMTPRAVPKGSGSSVNLKKDESRHVTFVSPVRGAGKNRRRKPVVP